MKAICPKSREEKFSSEFDASILYGIALDVYQVDKLKSINLMIEVIGIAKINSDSLILVKALCFIGMHYRKTDVSLAVKFYETAKKAVKKLQFNTQNDFEIQINKELQKINTYNNDDFNAITSNLKAIPPAVENVNEVKGMTIKREIDQTDQRLDNIQETLNHLQSLILSGKSKSAERKAIDKTEILKNAREFQIKIERINACLQLIATRHGDSLSNDVKEYLETIYNEMELLSKGLNDQWTRIVQ